MIQIGLPALPDSLSVAILPKNMLHSFLDWWRQVFLLVLLHPTPARCLNCSFESPFTRRDLCVDVAFERSYPLALNRHVFLNDRCDFDLNWWRTGRRSDVAVAAAKRI